MERMEQEFDWGPLEGGEQQKSDLRRANPSIGAETTFVGTREMTFAAPARNPRPPGAPIPNDRDISLDEMGTLHHLHPYEVDGRVTYAIYLPYWNVCVVQVD
jgi:hypothetical protein